MKRYQLLIVEDDKDLAQLTYDFFQQFEFDCVVVNEGTQAVQYILEHHLFFFFNICNFSGCY